MFLNALTCPEVMSKAMMNLSMVYLKKCESNAAQGNLSSAKDFVVKAADYLEQSKELLDEAISSSNNNMNSNEEDINELKRYVMQFKPLRLQCHRLLGSILFGSKEYGACENEFRKATESFPDIQGAWEMLARVLELQGKTDEVASIREKINQLRK